MGLRKCHLLLVLGLSSLLWTTPAAHAQIHNMQSVLATEAEEGLSGTFTASADWRSGNISYLFLSASPVARYKSGKHLGIATARIDQKTSRGDTIISRFFEHLRYRYQMSEHVLGEVFAQHTFDQVRRLQLRALFGAGPKFDLLKDDDYGLGIGVAYMLELERIKNDEIADAGAHDLAHRASSYIVGHYKLDERLKLLEVIYFQPRLTDAHDSRLLSESQIALKVNERLTFSTAFTVAYDSRPPQTVKRVDSALVSSVTLEL